MPYYLLLVGSPERILWDVQTFLNGEYAVGRLWFDDPDDCKAYIDRLIAYEQNQVAPEPGELLLIGTEHPGDPATKLGSEQLVQPLRAWLRHAVPGLPEPLTLQGDGSMPDVNGPGLRAKLKECVRNRVTAHPPRVLFTVTHGCPAQALPTTPTLGGLVCQDAPFPDPPAPQRCFSDSDAAKLPDLTGMVWFAFACYSAGDQRRVAPLPQKLLARGVGGWIGHVEPALDYSILGAARRRPQIGLYGGVLQALLRGTRIGHATDDLDRRAALYAAAVYGRAWTTAQQPMNLVLARDDCRNWVLLGDPAARLAAAPV